MCMYYILIGSEPLVLLWLSSQRYRFLIGKPTRLLAHCPAPSPPAQMCIFALGPCLGLGLETASSWPSLAQTNQH